jgi:hypothetical protein
MERLRQLGRLHWGHRGAGHPISVKLLLRLWRRIQVERLTCFDLFYFSHRQIGTLLVNRLVINGDTRIDVLHSLLQHIDFRLQAMPCLLIFRPQIMFGRLNHTKPTSERFDRL